METGFDTVVLNMNPDGWIPGVTNERTWVMLYGLDVCTERQLIIAGDNKGKVYFADARTNKEIAQHQLHKKGNKVHDEHLLCTPPIGFMRCLGHSWFESLCAPPSTVAIGRCTNGFVDELADRL